MSNTCAAKKMTVNWNSLHGFVKGQQGVTWSLRAVLSCKNSNKLFCADCGLCDKLLSQIFRQALLRLFSVLNVVWSMLDSEFLVGWFVQTGSVWWSVQQLNVQNKVCTALFAGFRSVSANFVINHQKKAKKENIRLLNIYRQKVLWHVQVHLNDALKLIKHSFRIL